MHLAILSKHVPMRLKIGKGEHPITLPPLTVVELLHASLESTGTNWFARPLWGHQWAPIDGDYLQDEQPTPKVCTTYDRLMRAEYEYSTVLTGRPPLILRTIQACPPNEPGQYSWRYRLGTHDVTGEPVLPGEPWLNQVQLVEKMEEHIRTARACVLACHPNNKLVLVPADTEGKGT